jgi:hypothetical protein
MTVNIYTFNDNKDRACNVMNRGPIMFDNKRSDGGRGREPGRRTSGPGPRLERGVCVHAAGEDAQEAGRSGGVVPEQTGLNLSDRYIHIWGGEKLIIIREMGGGGKNIRGGNLENWTSRVQ